MDEKDYEICGVESINYKWINSFVKSLKKEIDLEKIILFGSRAKNEHITWSDYDVAVISNYFNKMPPPERVSFVLKFWEGDRAIEPLCYTSDEFKKNKFLIIKEIKENGKVLYKKSIKKR